MHEKPQVPKTCILPVVPEKSDQKLSANEDKKKGKKREQKF